MKNTKVPIIILSVFLVISILINIIFLYSITIIDTEWRNDYELLDAEWCEIANKCNYVINDFIIELQYHDEYYLGIDLLEEHDCWS